jgi:ABC-type sugar transport system, permease component
MKTRVKKRNSKLAEFFKHFYILGVLLAVFFPFFIMIQLSFKDKKQVVFEFFSVLGPYHPENYVTAFTYMKPYFINTFIMAAGTAVLSIILATLAGYSFGKLKFPLSKIFYGIIFSKMLLPGVMNLIPSFILAKDLRILNSYWAVILFGAGVNMPYWVFVMTVFVKGMPTALFESMRLDGASELQVYRWLAIPMLKPMIALMGMNIFLAVWNDYIWPLVTISTQELRPLSVGIAMMTTTYPQETGMLMAGYVLSSIPLLILFIFAMRQFVEGLSAGSIKL